MLALIAGQGGLPLALAAALQNAGQPFRVYALEGFAPDLPDVTEFRVEVLGKFLRTLRKSGVTEVCFAGAMQRPAVDMSRLHPLSLPLVPRLMKVMGTGDDRLLREVVAIFEEAGLRVKAAHEIAPDLVRAPGPLTPRQPDDTELCDATRGAEILSTLGSLDLGQGCVVAQGLCLAIETLPGTDAMLGFVAQNRDRIGRVTGGIFVKRAKPGQDLRIDMPTIGPDTVTAAADAGLTGIAIGAGEVIVLEPKTVRERSADRGLTVWAMP